MQSDDDAEASTDISAAFAAAVKETLRAEGARKEAAKEAAKEARLQQKKAEKIALSAQGVTPARQAWGYKTAGPEPEPLFEISGILAGVLLFLGAVFFFSLAGQDQCVIHCRRSAWLEAGPIRRGSSASQSKACSKLGSRPHSTTRCGDSAFETRRTKRRRTSVRCRWRS